MRWVAFLVFLCICFTVSAEVIYQDKDNNTIMDVENIDYFMYKGKRLTFSGLCNAIIAERQHEFLEELRKKYVPRWVKEWRDR